MPESLCTTVAAARRQGEDAEAALRRVALGFRDDLLAAERAAAADGLDPSTLDAPGWQRCWPQVPAGQDGSEP